MESGGQVSVAGRWCLVGNVSQWFCLQIGLSEVAGSSSFSGLVPPGRALGTAISDKGAAVSKASHRLLKKVTRGDSLCHSLRWSPRRLSQIEMAKTPGSGDKWRCDGGECAIAQDLLFLCPVRTCGGVIALWTSTQVAALKGQMRCLRRKRPVVEQSNFRAFVAEIFALASSRILERHSVNYICRLPSL